MTSAFSMERSSDGSPWLFQINCSLSEHRKDRRSNSETQTGTNRHANYFIPQHNSHLTSTTSLSSTVGPEVILKHSRFGFRCTSEDHLTVDCLHMQELCCLKVLTGVYLLCSPDWDIHVSRQCLRRSSGAADRYVMKAAASMALKGSVSNSFFISDIWWETQRGNKQAYQVRGFCKYASDLN